MSLCPPNQTQSRYDKTFIMDLFLCVYIYARSVGLRLHSCLLLCSGRMMTLATPTTTPTHHPGPSRRRCRWSHDRKCLCHALPRERVDYNDRKSHKQHTVLQLPMRSTHASFELFPSHIMLLLRRTVAHLTFQVTTGPQFEPCALARLQLTERNSC